MLVKAEDVALKSILNVNAYISRKLSFVNDIVFTRNEKVMHTFYKIQMCFMIFATWCEPVLFVTTFSENTCIIRFFEKSALVLSFKLIPKREF